MIQMNPVGITKRQLAILAQSARGNVDRIYLHWTAGHYDDVYDEYHLNIGAAGEFFATCKSLTETKEHTWHRNSRAIGIAMCCCADAAAHKGLDTDFGSEPPTVLQIEFMAQAVAILTHYLKLPIDFMHVTTHHEAALFDGYGPYSGDPQTKWDLWYLPDPPLTQALKVGGEVIRGKALWYAEQYFKPRIALQPTLPGYAFGKEVNK